MDDRIDVTKRQTQDVLDFKQNKQYSHNKLK
jgi:RecB family exonuclease